MSVHLSTTHRKMSHSKLKCKHTDWILTDKLQILNKLECGMKGVDVSKLKDMVDAGKVLETKQNHKSFLPNVKRALHIWLGEMRSEPHAPPFNKQVLIEKAT